MPPPPSSSRDDPKPTGVATAVAWLLEVGVEPELWSPLTVMHGAVM